MDTVIGMVLSVPVIFIVLLLLLLPLIGYFGAFYSPVPGQEDILNVPTSEQYMKNRERMIADIKKADAIPYERVSVTAWDGTKLSGKYYHYADDAPCALCFHGYRATSIRDFSGGAVFLMEQRMNVLLVDQRATGESGTHTICFGIKEQKDCIDWIHYAKDRLGKDVPIMLYGISMGAATVLMASGLDLPENVKGIVADSPYSSVKGIICKVCRDLHLPARFMYPFIKAGARWFGKLDLEAGSVTDKVANASVPILIIHGEDDRFVPCEMSREIQESNPEKVERYTFPKAGHGISYVEDKPRYIRLVTAFIDRVLDR